MGDTQRLRKLESNRYISLDFPMKTGVGKKILDRKRGPYTVRTTGDFIFIDL
jgi:hypothetical protein